MSKKGAGIFLFIIAVVITVLVIKVKTDNNPTKIKEESWGVLTATTELYEKNDSEKCIGMMLNGNTVRLLAEKDGLIEVERGDIRGWVSSALVERLEYTTNQEVLTYKKDVNGEVVVVTPGSTEEPELSPEATPEVILARPIEWVNLRSGPSIDYEIIMVVQENQLVTILDDSQAWYRVNVEGVEGWIFNSYLEVIN